MGEPNALVFVALTTFLLVVASCFSSMSPRRAVLAAMLCGWLFLPHFDHRYAFLKIHTKAMFVPGMVLLGSFVFDRQRWSRLRLRLLDLPIAIVCVGRFATALSNDLGVKEALAATVEASLEWGAPYLLGRAYLGSPRALLEYATALVAAALAYVPFCLWEIRMSPGLQRATYGFQTWTFDQALRFGGYRPSVFMQHGLAVGLFMAVGALTALWLWRSGARVNLLGIPLGLVCAVLVGTTVLTKSTGAIILLAIGAALLESTRHIRPRLLILAFALAPAAYCTARLSGWEAEEVVAFVRKRVDEDRANSLRARIANEVLMIDKANKRPWFGWGRFGRSFAYTAGGRMATPDSLWILALGLAGLVGLTAIGVVLALPPLLLMRSYDTQYWGDPRIAPAAALGMALLLWATDNLLNDMMSPLFPAAAGALLSFAAMTADHRREAALRTPMRPAHRTSTPSALG